MSKPAPLANMRVLVTRPQQRAAAFVEMIQQAGGTAVEYPLIHIADADDNTQRAELLQQLADYDIAIFISPTAVEKTMAQRAALPASLTLVAIGSRTAQMLQQHGYKCALSADSHDSEGLLKQAEMQAQQVAAKKIIIFRGEGGRSLLADSLRQRGAEVVYANMYKRVLPEVAPLQSQQLQQLQAVCVTSNQGLENLMLLSDDQARLKTLPLFVPGQRAYKLALQLGFTDIHVSENASDRAMLAALLLWANQS